MVLFFFMQSLLSRNRHLYYLCLYFVVHAGYAGFDKQNQQVHSGSSTKFILRCIVSLVPLSVWDFLDLIVHKILVYFWHILIIVCSRGLIRRMLRKSPEHRPSVCIPTSIILECWKLLQSSAIHIRSFCLHDSFKINKS